MTADLTPTEVAALRQRAEAATPGDWYGYRPYADNPSWTLAIENPLGAHLHEHNIMKSTEDWAPNDADAAHIAGLDPATVLNLLDAAFDDTGQPWRDRAERAEALAERNGVRWCRCSRADRMNDRAHPDCPIHGTPMNEQRDEARATIDRAQAVRATSESVLAQVEASATAQVKADGPAAPHSLADGVLLILAELCELRRVLAGDQEKKS